MKQYRSSLAGKEGKVTDFNRYEFSGGTGGAFVSNTVEIQSLVTM
jgi:hypothetical protein